MSTRKKAAKPASTKTPKAKTSKARATPAAGRQGKPAAEQAPKKLGQLAAALKVLGEAEEPLNCKAIMEAMISKGYWKSPSGKTPQATLSSAILREITKKGRDSRFKKVERGLFTLSAKK